MRNNIVTAAFSGGRKTRTDRLWQYDYGQILRIVGLELPETFEVHFSNDKGGTSKTSVGSNNSVPIPDEYLTSGADIFAWIYLHTGQDDGETEYMVIIPVKRRAQPSDLPPTPQEQSAITEAIAALNDGAAKAEAAAEAAVQAVAGVEDIINTALQEAKDSGEFDGPQGPQGPAGYSPAASVSKSGNTATITITDQSGTTTAQITDGADGDDYVLTNQDKADIADIVAAYIGSADTMSF